MLSQLFPPILGCHNLDWRRWYIQSHRKPGWVRFQRGARSLVIPADHRDCSEQKNDYSAHIGRPAGNIPACILYILSKFRSGTADRTARYRWYLGIFLPRVDLQWSMAVFILSGQANHKSHVPHSQHSRILECRRYDLCIQFLTRRYQGPLLCHERTLVHLSASHTRHLASRRSIRSNYDQNTPH